MDNIFERVIVLASEDAGESGKKLVLLGETKGKFVAYAPGVARSKKRFPAGVENFVLYEAEIEPRKRLKTIGIKGARPLVQYSLSRDMAHYRWAARITEITNKMLPLKSRDEVFSTSPEDELEMRSYFGLLASSYATLDTYGPEEVESVGVWFLWRLLILAGYGIDPFRCPRCNREYNEENPPMWCEGTQGIFCRGCFEGSADGCFELSLSALRLSQQIISVAIPKGFAATVPIPKADPESFSELHAMLDAQIRTIIQDELKTDALMKQTS